MKRIIVLLLALASLSALFTFTGCDIKSLFLPEGVSIHPTCTEAEMELYRSIYQETGYNPVIEASDYTEQSITVNGQTHTQKVYTDVKINDFYAKGFHYYVVTTEEFLAIQEYQNRTGVQVMYPLVKSQDRPTHVKNKNDANLYYKLQDPAAIDPIPALDENGNFVPNYWAYAADSDISSHVAEYNSLRIEGENGVNVDGNNYFYAYGRFIGSYETIEIRVFQHTFFEYHNDANPDRFKSEEEYFKYH